MKSTKISMFQDNKKNLSIFNKNSSFLATTNKSNFIRNTISDINNRKSKKFEKSILNNEKIDSFDIEKNTIKEIVEKESVETKIMSLLDETIDVFKSKNLQKQEKETEKYELINKIELDSLVSLNEKLKTELKQLKENLKENNKVHLKTLSELNQIQQNYHLQEKLKTEVSDKIYQKREELKNLKIFEQKINEMRTKEKLDRTNMLKCLCKLEDLHPNKIPDDLKVIIKENRKFVSLNQETNENRRTKEDLLTLKINELQSEIEKKEKHLKFLKNL